MAKIKLKKIIAAMVIVLVIGLWVGGIIPQQIGKIVAINYVEKNHGEAGLTFVRMEYSRAHGDYFAVFKDTNGQIYNFLTHSKLLPTTMLYDPIRPPE